MALAGIDVPMRVELLANISEAHRIEPVEHRRRAVRVPPVGGKRPEMCGFVRMDRGCRHALELAPRARRRKIIARRRPPIGRNTALDCPARRKYIAAHHSPPCLRPPPSLTARSSRKHPKKIGRAHV